MIAGMIVCWSIYYAISKVIVGATGSAFLGGFLLRSAAFLFLTLQLAASGKLSSLFSCGRATWLLLLIGVLGFSQDILANLGYAHGSLSTGTALLKTDVIMANFVTVVLLKKKLFRSDWLGSVLMLAGVLLVLGVSFSDMSFRPGDLFFILSAAALTANAFVVKAAQKGSSIDSDIISYYNNFLVMSLSILGASLGGDVRADALGTIPGFWWLVAAGGLAQTGVYFFYYRNLKSHEVWIVKLYLLLIPVCSLFIGILFLNEQVTALKAAGIAIILIGAAIILLRDRINDKGAEPIG